MNGCTATFIVFFVAAATAPTGAARAADIAKTTEKDGTIVRLTDELLPECNRLNSHGTAYLQRAKRAQPACWEFDWKKRVFTVVPLEPRNTAEGLVAGMLRTLEAGGEAGMRELVVRYSPDSAKKRSIPAARFTWLQGKHIGR